MASVSLFSLFAIGLDVHEIRVEVDLSPGLPGFHIVGLADAAVQESKDRIRAALLNSGFSMPRGKITVNLAPANLHKIGSSFDLSIALGILIASGHLTLPKIYEGLCVVGELGLDGSIRGAQGAFLYAEWAQRQCKKVLLSEEAAARITFFYSDLYQVSALKPCVEALRRGQLRRAESNNITICSEPSFEVRLEDIVGHTHAKRGLEIAAAGGHHVCLWGPPGTGKTMLARALESITPPPSATQRIEIERIHSLRTSQAYAGTRPFRAPHHTISSAALIGGGSFPQPGEISLAHGGILFLDEFAEFARGHLDALRQPLQDRRVLIGRARYQCVFPCAFQLVAATNPCPCGFFGDTQNPCTCYETVRRKYMAKLSGPLLDRIDIHLHVQRQPSALLRAHTPSITSLEVRARVHSTLAFRAQREGSRNDNTPQTLTLKNLSLFGFSSEIIDEVFLLAEQEQLSARSLVKLCSLARTIADLEQSAVIKKPHLHEAWSFKESVSSI